MKEHTGAWVPSTCTLPTAEQPLRVAEFDTLLTKHASEVSRPEPTRLSVQLHPAPDVAARAADLAVRETGCCSFFTFTLTAGGGTLSLDIGVPQARVDVLDALAEQVRG